MDGYYQTDLFNEPILQVSLPRPVNVASVPQRSPFRYPGGKTWFVPTFREWVRKMTSKPTMLVEPFAGGGIITLTALFEKLVESAVMVEIDEEIAAVWQCIVEGNATWLAKRILDFDLSLETVINELAKKSKSTKAIAFQTILKNRTYHGGILAEGSGFLKYGENGKGIKSRWYPATLAKRLSEIALVAPRIDFRRQDGLAVMNEYMNNSNAIFFIDPPYTAGGKKAGKRLYRYYDIDHAELFNICQKVKGKFLITYDNSEEVKKLARDHKFEMRLIPMTNTHHAKMEELVISKDLAWMDRFPRVHQPDGIYKIKK